MDKADRPDFIYLAWSRLFDIGVLHGYQADQAGSLDRLLDKFDRAGDTHHYRGHSGGENHGVAQGQDG